MREKLSKEASSHVTHSSGHVTNSPGHVTDSPGHVIEDGVLSKLQQQNNDLHNIISQMRAEMEAMTEPTNQVAVSYVQYMEQELTELKSKNRDLEVKVQYKPLSSDKRPPPSPSTVPVAREGRQSIEETHKGNSLIVHVWIVVTY